ncbi:DDE superfamily endonuclease domain-containing protein [Phthorimaea operculella]|nr:DDE superfamily endonuclease domain-containing protein [Phthorimaea operculella]
MRPFVSHTLRWRVLAITEESIRRRRHLRAIQRRRLRVLARKIVDLIHDMSEKEFVKTYRLDKRSVINIIKKIRPYMRQTRRVDGITVKSKVLAALCFYATGSYQTLVGQSAFHNISQTSVSRAVRQVTRALKQVYGEYIQWPRTLEERNAIKAKFYKFKIPGVVGAIDGTHIAILRPEHNEERYINRKGYHSLNVLLICDADLNILCVDASSPGSSHDSSVWQSHPLSHHLAELSDAGEQVFLLGDSGYPLRTSMMTPILNTTPGTPEHYYYQCQVTARNTVERCIGVLKARFRYN